MRRSGRPLIAVAGAIAGIGAGAMPSRACCSAAMNSSALAKRWAGSLASARIVTASSAALTSGLRRLGGLRLGGDLLERDRDGGLALERHASGQQLVQHHADRVQVRALADGVPLGLLGREVLRGAHDRPGQRHVGGAGAGDAEVGDLGATLLVEDHVVGLDVAVDDAAPVGEAGGEQDLHDDVDRIAGRQRAVLAHDRLQRASRQVLHRDVVGAVPLAAIEHGDHIGVGEPGGAGGLAAEALDELLVLGEAMVQQLERDLASEQRVVGEVHVGHAAGAEPLGDAIAPVDQGAGLNHCDPFGPGIAHGSPRR